MARIVKDLRHRQKVSQTVLAQLSNVGIRFLFDVEHGKTTMQFGKLLEVLKTMGITLKAELPPE